ncbi:MAG: ABC transporter permease [Bacteroides sp.]|nr:ABC transporter permease [Bacteroides sp.]
MLHCIKYELIGLFRNKIVIFWLLGFPIILGTLFYAAFGSLADNDEAFRQIPIAVIEGEAPPAGLDIMLELLSEGEDGLFSIKTRDHKEAEELLENGALQGIIYADEEIVLETAEGAGIEAGIIKSVLDGFKTRSAIIADIAATNPEGLEKALGSIDADIDCITSSYNSANNDPYVQYFYNLLAMAGLMGSMMGMYCAVNHQANLSALGARIELSPVKKLKDILSSLIAAVIVHNIFTDIGAAYLVFVLKIDFRVGLGYILIINFIACLLGDTMGCFIGSVGTASEGVKNAVLLAVSLGLCAASGLMFGGMQLLIEETFPLFNRINPASLIVNCFYSLSVYNSFEKFAQSFAALTVWCVLLTAGSLIMMRTRKYKAL